MILKNKSYLIWCSEWILLGLLLLGTYGICVEPYKIEIHHVYINDSTMGEILKGKCVVQLSDLHMGTIGKRENEVLKILDKLQPDLVFLTGDYVRWSGAYDAALDFLSRLKAKIGIWAVMGDYDYSRSRKSCIFCHEEGSGKQSRRHSVRFLRDTVEPITLAHGVFWIGGIDYEGEHSFDVEKKMLFLKENRPLIILCHNPLFFDRIDSEDDVLILAGDTHGGQIPLPAWLLGILGYEKNARYSQGLFEKGKKKMFVSRGIGTSHLPIRICRRPEVVVLHFR